MVVKLGQILQLVDSGALQALSAQPMPVATAFRVNRIADVLGPAASRAQACRATLFTTENSVPTGPGGARTIIPEHIHEYIAAVMPLLEEAVEVVFVPLAIAQLEGLNLTPDQLRALDPLLEA